METEVIPTFDLEKYGFTLSQQSENFLTYEKKVQSNKIIDIDNWQLEPIDITATIEISGLNTPYSRANIFDVSGQQRNIRLFLFPINNTERIEVFTGVIKAFYS